MVRWWAITRTELVRLFRDRGNIFFVLVFPLLLVVLIGASFGGGMDARLGVVADTSDPAAQRVVAGIDDLDGVVAVEVTDADALQDQVSRGNLRGGIVVPDGYGGALLTADPVEIQFVGRQDGSADALRTLVDGLIADQAARADAAAAIAEAGGLSAEDAAAAVDQTADTLPGITVVATELTVEDSLEQEFAGLGQFDLGASSQLFLFTFLTAITGAAALIQSRQLGVARRMFSTSTPMPVLLTGMAGGRIAVALFQAAYIVATTWILFRVNWGDPLATSVVVILFCLVAGGAGMLVGATFRNDSQAAGVGVGLGLGMAALGGSMAPIEIFPDTLQRIALITPHAWANRAMATLVRRDGALGDVAFEVAVLATYALALLVAATVVLHRNLTR